MKHFLSFFTGMIVPLLLLVSGCKKDDDPVTVAEPEITSMQPASGPRGTIVTLTGNNFSDDITRVSVYVNGKLSDVISATTTTIDFEVPSNAGDGVVTISINGNGASGPVFDFIYTVTVSMFSGSSMVPGFVNGTPAMAQFNSPRGMAIDNLNNLYVADELNHCIRKITTGGSVTTFAGTGNAGHQDGAYNVARFNHPYDIVFDPIQEYFYVADRDNHCIRKISMLGDVITIAGIPGIPGYVDAPGLSARFLQPTGITVEGEPEKIFIADAGNHCIRKLDNFSIVTTLAGSSSVGNIDGTGASAKFNSPLDITWDTAGFFVVTDIANHNVRRLSENGTVTTIGGAGAPGYLDGPGWQSLFNTPGCVVSQNNESFICDAMNNRLRKIETSGEVITLAGDGNAGAINGAGMQSRFNQPAGIIRDSYGNLYISDRANHAIRKVTLE